MAGITLRRLEAAEYVRDVLPQTAALWAGRRDFDTYVAQTLEIAESVYGRRHYRTFALFDGERMVASFKRYDRIARVGDARLRTCGIGAVFTPEQYRGRGYASVMLASALDAARAGGYDAAFLFSDIAPQFYAPLGFVALPSREIALRADTLPARRLEPAALSERDWPGVRRCYESGEAPSPAGFARAPSTWDFLRMRLRHELATGDGRQTDLVLRRGRSVVAYVLGARVPERDTYAVDEFGCAGTEAAGMIPPLLRAAAGDLRRIIGWLPPAGARELLPAGTVRKRRLAVFMAAPLTAGGKDLVAAFAEAGRADPCWHADHV